VDSASEVLKISDLEIEPPPNVFSEAGTNYVTGVAKYQGRLIILVDLRKILQSGDLRLPPATEGA
jgi:purine-binding chemotaxis protein CheW